MFKKLQMYYVIVTLPFILLISGAAYFSDAIKSTIVRNPHPQINYVIFIIILFGGGLIIVSVFRLMREAKIIKEYSEAIRLNMDWATIQQLANTFVGDISYVLQMVASTGGRLITHQEQVAIEHELVNARARLMRRNALPQYLSGLLVGMGLLGTFVGLLSTLTDIGVLISSFADLDMATASPLLVFRTMIERMKAPMQSMSIAFSASMFGLLGSIILGLMMLGIRRLQGDISSLLSSEVARYIESALSHEMVEQGKSDQVTNGNCTNNVNAGEEHKVLLRIEERLAESVRFQQRALAAELDDFQKQRADMLRAITEQTNANNSLRSEFQQLCRQFETTAMSMDKGRGELTSHISELTVNLAAGAKESQKLLSMQMDEQKRLRDTIDGFKIEERLTEALKVQQRSLSSELDDFQKQRNSMVHVIAEQTEASNNFRAELQQLGRQFESMVASMDSNNGNISNQLNELIVHMAADAKESHKLLTMQVSEQIKLRQSIDARN